PPSRLPASTSGRALWWSVGLAVVLLVGAVGWQWSGNRLGQEMLSLVRGVPATGMSGLDPAAGESGAGDDAAARALAAAERARLALEGRAAVAPVPAPMDETSASSARPQPVPAPGAASSPD